MLTLIVTVKSDMEELITNLPAGDEMHYALDAENYSQTDDTAVIEIQFNGRRDTDDGATFGPEYLPASVAQALNAMPGVISWSVLPDTLWESPEEYGEITIFVIEEEIPAIEAQLASADVFGDEFKATPWTEWTRVGENIFRDRSGNYARFDNNRSDRAGGFMRVGDFMRADPRE